jgi:glutaminyl-peptide cyclotransferase
MQPKWRWAFLIILLLASVIIISIVTSRPVFAPAQVFNAARAMQDVATQVSFGPRIPGSEAHAQTVTYISDELLKAGWQVEIQETTSMGHPIRNIIAKRGNGQPWVILGAHYDTRLLSDHDPDPTRWNDPVTGANDGASGVAVLLELARVLPMDNPLQIWLVFFDAEDQGKIPGWDWILGSRAFVESLQAYPEKVVIVDMIGDADLNIYQERNSNPQITAEIWAAAAELGYEDYFIPEVKYSILDDHTPFLEKGIPAIDVIDFDYPYWHTTADTLDKVSEKSLEIVGKTLFKWLSEH